MADRTKHHVGEPWEQAEPVFLADALARGMPFAEGAAFLDRTEGEVRQQSKAIKYQPRPRVRD